MLTTAHALVLAPPDRDGVGSSGEHSQVRWSRCRSEQVRCEISSVTWSGSLSREDRFIGNGFICVAGERGDDARLRIHRHARPSIVGFTVHRKFQSEIGALSLFPRPVAARTYPRSP